jgi:hypothetical protein
VDLDDRKVRQPLDDRNVVVGSCLIGQPVGDHGEKAKADRASDVRSQAPEPSG